ncbi:MAG: hypothetical protein GY810_04590 [Aureispira sp.]|nr:hypothetical protein [Aureispira sp.]
MNRILFVFLAIGIIVGACRKENTSPAKIELSSKNLSAQKDAGITQTFSIDVSNTGKSLGSVVWEQDFESALPAGWIVNTTVGTDNKGSAATGNFELAASAKTPFAISINPNGVTGTVRLSVHFSLQDDPTAVQTATFELQAINTPKGVVITLSGTNFTGSGSHNAAKEYTVSIQHDASVDANIAWRRVNDTIPTGWITNVTAANNSATSDATGAMTIGSGSSSLFKVNLNPNGNEGRATTTILYYVTTDSAATVKEATFEYTAVNSTQPTITLSNSSFTDSGDSTTAKEFSLNVNYDGPSAATIHWRRVSENIPSGWATNITTGTTSQGNNTTGSFTLSPASASAFKFNMDPQSIAGTGNSTVLFYVEGDSAATVKEASFEYTATGNTVVAPTVLYSLADTAQTGSGTSSTLEGKVYIDVTNETSSSLPLKWKRVNETKSTGWDIYICFGQCFGPAMMSNVHPMNANATDPFEVHFAPNGAFGSGHTEILIWSPTDSVGTVRRMHFDYSASK